MSTKKVKFHLILKNVKENICEEINLNIPISLQQYYSQR